MRAASAGLHRQSAALRAAFGRALAVSVAKKKAAAPAKQQHANAASKAAAIKAAIKAAASKAAQQKLAKQQQ
jgi:hypothetical protein